MAHTYKYALLKAIPDQRRGERVNIGIVAFRERDIDVRFSDIAKLRAISNLDWDSYVAAATERMKESFSIDNAPADFLGRYSVLESVIRFSDISWFSAETPDEYEMRIWEIVDSLV